MRREQCLSPTPIQLLHTRDLLSFLTKIGYPGLTHGELTTTGLYRAAHTGGEVVSKHHGQSKTLQTSNASQSFACWYSNPGLTRPLANKISLEKELFQKTLKIWHRDLSSDIKVRSHLYYALEHQYTQAGMSLQALKAKDFVRAGTGSSRSYQQATLCYVLGVAGERRARICQAEPEWQKIFPMCLEGDLFLDLKVTKEEYKAYTGNESPAATHWYCRVALVIVPHGSLGKYLPRSAFGKLWEKYDIHRALLYLGQMCSHKHIKRDHIGCFLKIEQIFTTQFELRDHAILIAAMDHR
ncbi:hypothetical protein PTTG_09830 [Puccinia triticina 1-1 BBBD Race 1]|uniref:Uncharacterized protein n=1 Tax=Puccinia triticina (isolate 1-1 / race 1 (BBBD)) TaxID=630390 RepID=A0A180GF43_PUCT1|nr:hypothetical protein PTTG_09830 [Puccinia triticina 1-1 BBBD Race 1]